MGNILVGKLLVQNDMSSCQPSHSLIDFCMQFAFTLFTFFAVALIAVNVLNLDVDEILDAAKSSTKK